MVSKLKKILYAEDDKDIQTVVKIILKHEGNYELECCNTGTKVLEIASWFEPDLIILDVNMPEMDGPATFKSLRLIKSLEEVPIIFMTARVQKNEIEYYHKLGISYVIIKPFAADTLVETIENVWLKLTSTD